MAGRYDERMNASGKSGGVGKLIVVVIVWIALASVGFVAFTCYQGRGGDRPADEPADRPAATAVEGGPRPRAEAAERVTVGVAYGTEKRQWLTAAMGLWEQTDAAEQYDIELIPMGSVEGARAVVEGDERIHVWSPASAMYRPAFEQEWRTERDSPDGPIAGDDLLVYTPMAFVFWAERYAAFERALGPASFETIAAAMADDRGWAGIAGESDWGYFKLGHTHPNKSNSGLMTLVLMAYDLHDKTGGLTNDDVLDRTFLDRIEPIERGQSRLIDSTGTLMKDMVIRGPGTYDGVMVYESVALGRARDATGRYGELRVVYPPVNVWNDNPYYVLDVPWSTPRHRAGARAFGDFLLSEPAQRLALEAGFRPSDTSIPTSGQGSPFEEFKGIGVRADDIGTIVDFPDPAVLRTLQEGWERRFGGR